MLSSGGGWRRTALLALGGGLGFWLANFAISLTPIAAEYRAALSISYVPMLIEALIAGLVIGFGVGYCLVRFFDSIPTRGPVTKSVILSLIALVMFSLLIEVPAKFLTETGDALRYFIIGPAFNTLRFLVLGLVIGYLYRCTTGRMPR